MKFNQERTIQGFRAFYTEVLKRKFTQKHETALNEIFSMIAEDQEWDKGYDIRHTANFLAQTGWESGFTYLPIEEIRAKPGTELRKKQDKYWEPFHGRGIIQVTHKSNYEKVGKLLGIDLVNRPELILTDKKISYLAAARGMQFGIFTGKKLKDYINEHETNYFEARRIVNLLDRAKEIEGFSKAIESILESAQVEKIYGEDSEFYQPEEVVTDWNYKEYSNNTVTTTTTEKPGNITTVVTTTESQRPTIIDDKNSEPILIEKHIPEKLRNAWKYIFGVFAALGISTASLTEFINNAFQNRLMLRVLLIICAISIILGLISALYVMARSLLERKYAHELTIKEMELTASPDKYSVKVCKDAAIIKNDGQF